MFKNRAIQVKMVKNENEEIPQIDQSELFLDKAAVIGTVVKEAFMTIGKVGLLYIAADTIRQIAVNKTN